MTQQEWNDAAIAAVRATGSTDPVLVVMVQPGQSIETEVTKALAAAGFADAERRTIEVKDLAELTAKLTVN